MKFFELLEKRIESTGSFLCVGLDPHSKDVPEQTPEALVAFCKRLIEATKEIACCYKPNSAFFEAVEGGDQALKEVISLIPSEIPVLLDVKRGDISTTAQAYAQAAERTGATGVTLNAYMGSDAIKPFETENWGGCFILCKTSNPSSNEFQTLPIKTNDGKEMLLYEAFAKKAEEWGTGIVVGATDIEALRRARAAAPNVWILAPGVGAQGGDLEEALHAGLRQDGKGIIIPVSRGIARAEDPHAEAISLDQRIKASVEKVMAEKKLNEADSTSSLLEYQKDFIECAIKANVLKFGEFTLKSGRKSPYFFNAGAFFTGEHMFRVANSYADTIINSGIEFDVLFGPAYKGIPLAACVALCLHAKGKDIAYAYNRKEEKDHGEGGKIVGAPVEGKKVLIIDDVITAGTAVRESLTMLKNLNAEVIGLVIALNRQEKANDSTISAVAEVERDYGFKVYSIISLHTLCQYLEKLGRDDDLKKIHEYRELYGAN
ncbi:hypothetical protein WA158_008023 [Blastocystis sp. Blastoise]